MTAVLWVLLLASVALNIAAVRLLRRLQRREAELAAIATAQTRRVAIAREALKVLQARRKRPHIPPVLPFEPVTPEDVTAGEGEFWIEPVSDPDLGTIVSFGTEDGIIGTALWPEGEEK